MRKANKVNVSLHTHRNSLCDINANSATCFLADQDKLGGVTAALVPPCLCLTYAVLWPIPHLTSWLNRGRNGSMVRKASLASRVAPGFGHSAQETCAHVASFSPGSVVLFARSRANHWASPICWWVIGASLGYSELPISLRLLLDLCKQITLDTKAIALYPVPFEKSCLKGDACNHKIMYNSWKCVMQWLQLKLKPQEQQSFHLCLSACRPPC